MPKIQHMIRLGRFASLAATGTVVLLLAAAMSPLMNARAQQDGASADTFGAPPPADAGTEAPAPATAPEKTVTPAPGPDAAEIPTTEEEPKPSDAPEATVEDAVDSELIENPLESDLVQVDWLVSTGRCTACTALDRPSSGRSSRW